MNNKIPDRRIVYKTIGTTKLEMHLFVPGKNISRSAIVFFFGGGWTGGTPSQFYPQCKYFASNGILAISAEYRIMGKHNTTPFESIKDAKSAIRWIRAHASELVISPDKIVASGGSAGGHIAACTALIQGMDEEGEDLKVSSVPNSLVLFNPVIDTTDKGYGSDKLKGKETEISPVHHVVKGLPPTLIFHGTADNTVPFENVERFKRLMDEAGNTCELMPFEGKCHGFFNHRRAGNADFEKTMEMACGFLVRTGLMDRKNPIPDEKAPQKHEK